MGRVAQALAACLSIAICVALGLGAIGIYAFASRYAGPEVVRAGGGAFELEFRGEWPTEGRRVATRAAEIIASQVDIRVPITVSLDWVEMDEDTLGMGGPGFSISDFPGAREAATWYPSALANQLAGDRRAGGPDIETSYNRITRWHVGLDGNPPPGKSDLLTTVIHEILHGMGFLGTMSLSGGEGSWGDDDGESVPVRKAHRHVHLPPRERLGFARSGVMPDIYDRFVADRAGRVLIDLFPNRSRDLGRQLTSGALYWAGRETQPGARPKLYAPSEWSQGSSVAHLDDDTYDGGPDALITAAGSMIPSTSLGPVTLRMLKDMGWTLR